MTTADSLMCGYAAYTTAADLAAGGASADPESASIVSIQPTPGSIEYTIDQGC